MNLPYRIVGAESDTLDILYTATGTMLRKTYRQNGIQQYKRDYIGNKTYLNDQLTEIMHENGRINKNNTTFTYEYHLKDHLGNIRTVFYDKNGDGIVANSEVLQRKDYYAFGLDFKGAIYGQNASLSANRYGYNGKENVNDMDLGASYHGGRWADLSTGRWLQVDDMAAKMPSWSTFSMNFNNPMKFLDPSGMIPTPYQAALIAQHVYNSNVKLEGGWIQSTRTFGLTFGIRESGLRSMLYERTVNNITEFVYAFAGSETLKDWSQNAVQFFGKSEEFKEAIDNSRALSEDLGKIYELTFVGHSQGGGEAAASVYATGRNAITFNAGGVSKRTLRNNNIQTKKGSMNSNILAFIMTSDPLNFSQNTNSPTDVNFGLMPDVDGARFYFSPTSVSSALNGHSLDSILDEIVKYFKTWKIPKSDF